MKKLIVISVFLLFGCKSNPSATQNDNPSSSNPVIYTGTDGNRFTDTGLPYEDSLMKPCIIVVTEDDSAFACLVVEANSYYPQIGFPTDTQILIGNKDLVRRKNGDSSTRFTLQIDDHSIALDDSAYENNGTLSLIIKGTR